MRAYNESAALDQIDNQHHNRNHEQDVNESAQRVGADQSKRARAPARSRNIVQSIRFPFG